MCREYAGKELQGLWIVAVILICLVKFSQGLFLFHFFAITFLWWNKAVCVAWSTGPSATDSWALDVIASVFFPNNVNGVVLIC